MKKRLLALALCLVLAASLLPITAAAVTYYHVNSVEIEADGVYLGDDDKYHLNITDWKIVCEEGTIDRNTENSLTGSDFYTNDLQKPTNPSEEGARYKAFIAIGLGSHRDGVIFAWRTSPSFILRITGYEAVIDPSYRIEIGNPDIQPVFLLTKKHDHDWQFTQTENTLTAECQKHDTPPVTLSLSAHSVTLPESPFNAQLAGKEQFETATGAAISKIRYDYKGSDGVWHKGVDPVAANAKAGEYQAFVEISNLPGLVVDESGNILNQNGEASLYVKYTAADPKVTAQTGDNRPIELMMAGAVLFSALAAAAFLLDRKRGCQR